MASVVRSRAGALVLVVSLLSVPAFAEGLTSIPYGDTCWSTGTDADGDGLNDDCEQQVASAFMPALWIAKNERGADRRPYFAVKSQSFALRTLRIFYLAAFYEDHGVLGGVVDAHDGDTEFQVLEVHYSDGRWLLDWAFLSAHLETVCESSSWYGWAQLEYASESRGAPRIYAAQDKHGSYNSVSTCDRGGCYADGCSQGRVEPLDPDNRLASRNVGSTGAPLINAVTFRGQTERLLDDVEFKGWDNQWYRPNATPYRARLIRFGF
ncbi:MAG: hypothetical protein EOO71_16790 [Myxococcaceae bacterium]|nr:MAG: hypothetical protein EOO71_16790 [Myxococcaceae bacterium]